MPPALEAWRRRGRTIRVHGREIFIVEAGAAEAEAILVLHGFPSFSYDFHRVLDRLAQQFRVVVHDQPGFGLSAKPADYSYSLFEQADVALGAWRQLGVTAGHLLAHDYGTSVATELLARRELGLLPLDVRSVTLSNGSVHRELARLRLSQRLLRSRLVGPVFARLVGRRYFKSRMRRLWAEPRRADDGDLEVLWAGIETNRGRQRLPRISAYLDERLRFRHRWIGALTRLDLPVHILWGRHDPVAVPLIAQRLAAEIPGARLTWLEKAGHYPLLEDPDEWTEKALEFLLCLHRKEGCTPAEGPRPEGGRRNARS